MWRGGGAELTRGLTAVETLESPVTAERRERRYFDYGQVHRRCYARCLRFVDAVDASDASDCPDTTPTRRALASKPAGSKEWQLDTLNWLVGVVVVGANARTYEQRMDRRMRRTKIRQGDALEVPSERRITIRTTTALTNTSLKGFCICSSCRRCGCRYKVTNRSTPAGLGLKRLQPLVARPRCTSRRRSASKLPHRSFVAGSG